MYIRQVYLEVSSITYENRFITFDKNGILNVINLLFMA